MPASRSCGRRGSAPSRCRRPESWRRGSCTCACAATAGWRRACCRAVSGRLGRPLDHAGDRMPDHTPGSLDVVPVAEGRELPALLTALKAHLELFGPDEVVVLSPFG